MNPTVGTSHVRIDGKRLKGGLGALEPILLTSTLIWVSGGAGPSRQLSKRDR